MDYFHRPVTDFKLVKCKTLPGLIAIPIHDLTDEQLQEIATEEFEKFTKSKNMPETRLS